MNFFDVLSLLGGLAMFLYGMRLMGDSLKENSSGTLKKVMEKVTDNALKAFVLGIAVTALGLALAVIPVVEAEKAIRRKTVRSRGKIPERPEQ